MISLLFMRRMADSVLGERRDGREISTYHSPQNLYDTSHPYIIFFFFYADNLSERKEK